MRDCSCSQASLLSHSGWHLGYLTVVSCPIWHGMVEIALFPFSELKLFREMFTPSFLWCAAARNTKMIVLISLSLSLYQVCGLLSIFISQNLHLALEPQRGKKGIPGNCFGTNWIFPHWDSQLLSSGDIFIWAGGVTQAWGCWGPFLGLIQHQHSRDAFRGWAVILGLGVLWCFFGKSQLFND